jgi:hypothetical protein
MTKGIIIIESTSTPPHVGLYSNKGLWLRDYLTTIIGPTLVYSAKVFFFGQFCDVTKLTIIHKKILSNLVTN